MNFFDAFTDGNLARAARKTEQDIMQKINYANRHRHEAALGVGLFIGCLICNPEMTTLVVCVSAVALFCFNLFNPPSYSERAGDYIIGQIINML